MKNKGFTLVELLIVVAIIAVLASLVVVSIGLAGQRARVAQAKTQIKNLEIALSNYYNDVGYYPFGDTENDLGITNVVEALSGKPRSEGGGGGPNTPYWEFKEKELDANKALLDPWKKPWRYISATNESGVTKQGVHNEYSFDIYSCGPNGIDEAGENDRSSGKDDINNWTGE
ncbi:MAG: type II secretion system protein [Planctomycetota bacterium]